MPLLQKSVLLFTLLLASTLNGQTLHEAKLERKLAYPDSVIFLPLTLLAHVENSKLPNDYSGWVLESDFKKSNNRSVIILEMNSSDLMGYQYSSGSVQLIIEFPKLKKNQSFDLNSKEIQVHQVNNYGGFKAEDVFPKGKINIEIFKDKLAITGNILLETQKSYTKQVIHLKKTEFVTFSLKNYLLAQEAREILRELDYDKIADALVDKMLNDTTELNELNNSTSEVENEKLDTSTFDFKLNYRNIGLGSNRFYPSRIMIEVRDSILNYGIMELSDEIDNIDFATGDTTFKHKRVWYSTPFSMASRDSIALVLKPIEGKYVSLFNLYLMSGSIDEIYFENRETCTKIRLKNASDEIELNIYKIINPYIPEEYRWRIPNTQSPIDMKVEYYKSINDCTGDQGKTKK